MTTWRHAVYMILDELKLSSDDTYFNEEHIMFLLNKYRSFILKQKYGSDVKKHIPDINYQTISFNTEIVPAIDGTVLDGGIYISSKIAIPQLMDIGTKRAYNDYYNGEIAYITRDRMRYVGTAKWQQNLVYCSLNTNNKLYLKSLNPQCKYIEHLYFTAVFQDAIEAWKYRQYDGIDNILDSEIPLEDNLLPSVSQMVREELSNSKQQYEDVKNNSNDDNQ